MNPVRQAIYQRLAGDATLIGMLATPTAIWHQLAPQDAPLPYVVFHRQSGRPAWTLNAGGWQDDVWLVKAIDRGDTASRAEAIDARTAAVLNDAPLAVNGRPRLAVFRESDVDYSELLDGGVYRHCGGLYRLLTQPT